MNQHPANDEAVSSSDTVELARDDRGVEEQPSILPVTLALGRATTCAWRAGGTVYCWGGSSIPEPIGDIAELAIAKDGTCILMQDGTVTCWTESEDKAVKVEYRLNGLSEVLDIASGGETICALDRSGTVYCGLDAHKAGESEDARELVTLNKSICTIDSGGAIGCWVDEQAAKRYTSSPLPWSLEVPSGKVLALVSGSDHYCALSAEKTAYCWGGQVDKPTLVPNLTDVVQLEASDGYTCARLEDATVKCWGNVPQPYWGDPEVDEHDDVPNPTSPWTLPNIENVIDIALGPGRMCVTLSDERVLCWGWGQDGTPPEEPRFSAVPLLIGGLEDVVDLSLGDKSACALKSDQSIWCWGDNSIGQLGFESVWKEWGTPQLAQQVPPGAVKLVMNGDTGCAISDSGKLVCWGDKGIDVPVWSSPLEWEAPSSRDWTGHVGEENANVEVTNLSLDNEESCFVARDGGVSCCCDLYGGGECGPIEGIKGAKQVRVRLGVGCALASGNVYCWGNVAYGSEKKASRRPPIGVAPQRVRKLKPAIEIFQGPNGFCARHKNGNVSCWETSFDDREHLVLGPPSPLEGVGNVVQISHAEDYYELAQHGSGRNYTCAVHKDGTVSCWGMLVDDIESETPTIIEGLEGVAQVEIGGTFACARLEDGTIKCWCEGYSGQLGISRRYRPVELNWKEKLLPQ